MTSGAAMDGYSYGICADNNLTIKGGTVTATGGAADVKSYGICAADYINITGGNVTGIGSTANDGSYGLYVYNYDINISGGTVKAYGGKANYSYGISADDGMEISTYSSAGHGTGTVTVTAAGGSSHIDCKVSESNVTTINFNANTGSGEMIAYTNDISYTLPANGFTAPSGKQFKAWSVGGTEKAVGDKITVTADTTVKAVWETLPAAPADYDILNGANSKWTQDSDGNISVRGSGEFSKFVGVKVDGKTVDEKYYTVKEGSTIVTLKPEYLNTLTAGKHTLEIVWTDGTADTTFTVDSKPANTDTKSPQTGDSSSIALWIALLFVSAAGVLSTAVLGKKKKRSAK